MRVAAIIQARMGSTRLPGKILLPLAGRPVLSRVLERAVAIPRIDQVVCATPADPEDDAVADEAARAGVMVTRGSRDDVLDRYHAAAKAADADIILRITSDCPLIDPAICGEVVDLLQREGADFACMNAPVLTWPHGLECEAFSFAWLDRARREAFKPSEREHVSTYIRGHPETRLANLNGPGVETARHRWTLDHPEDLTYLRAIFERLPDGPAGWSWRVPFAIAEADPRLSAMNAGHDHLEGLRKSQAQDRAAGFA